MNVGYTSEQNVEMLINLMKQHGVTKVVASPGTTNATFVASLQGDPDFTLYSSVDERSAAYMACGIAAESHEPVALSCTGATASRNYVPGLTEAYYRHLPILAVTSMQHPGRVGQLVPQVLDRTEQMNDICVASVQIEIPHTPEDLWACNTRINDALLALTHAGSGPVHINLQTNYSTDFSAKTLPDVRVIRRYCHGSSLPEIQAQRIAVFVGAHLPFSSGLTRAIDAFCEHYGAVVLCDQTSNYRGPYRVLAPLVTNQDASLPECANVDLIIHIGQVSGASMRLFPREVWRVSPDGVIRDAFKKMTAVFEMEEAAFFETYSSMPSAPVGNSYLNLWKKAEQDIRRAIPELPFSNLWVAQQSAGRLPHGCAVHLGILNTLRSWNMFETPDDVECFSNTGGFGIDGNLSTALGASLANPDRLVYCILGDLAFFYDMNALGNRMIAPNLRVMVINNGRGTEFRNYCHMVSRFGEDADDYLAAAGHFGNKSPDLLKHYAKDLGCAYRSASSKEELLNVLDEFFDSEPHAEPMVLEVFTDSCDESDALYAISNIAVDAKGMAKRFVKKAFGQKGIDAIKGALNK